MPAALSRVESSRVSDGAVEPDAVPSPEPYQGDRDADGPSHGCSQYNRPKLWWFWLWWARSVQRGGRRMLTHEENELITRIGAGTAMGDTMRRYWIPALLASELP